MNQSSDVFSTKNTLYFSHSGGGGSPRTSPRSVERGHWVIHQLIRHQIRLGRAELCVITATNGSLRSRRNRATLRRDIIAIPRRTRQAHTLDAPHEPTVLPDHPLYRSHGGHTHEIHATRLAEFAVHLGGQEILGEHEGQEERTMNRNIRDSLLCRCLCLARHIFLRMLIHAEGRRARRVLCNRQESTGCLCSDSVPRLNSAHTLPRLSAHALDNLFVGYSRLNFTETVDIGRE